MVGRKGGGRETPGQDRSLILREERRVESVGESRAGICNLIFSIQTTNTINTSRKPGLVTEILYLRNIATIVLQ